MKYHFILNPVAGRGKAYRAIKYIRNLLRNLNIEHEFSITSYPGHATEIASKAKNNCKVVTAIGGDGTVNEVINGLSNSDCGLGLIPLGSGNDFAKAINMSLNIDESLNIILLNKYNHIDIGKVKTEVNNDNTYIIKEERYFINSIGIGFDATVALESKKIKFLRGLPLYLISTFNAFLKYRAPNFKLKIDELIYNNKYFLITIGNGISSGGGFKLTPKAKLDDSKFDVCFVEDLNFFKIIKMLPSAIKGLHDKYKEDVHFEKARFIEITSDSHFNVHADGEIVGQNVNKATIELIPWKIKVIQG